MDWFLNFDPGTQVALICALINFATLSLTTIVTTRANIWTTKQTLRAQREAAIREERIRKYAEMISTGSDYLIAEGSRDTLIPFLSASAVAMLVAPAELCNPMATTHSNIIDAGNAQDQAAKPQMLADARVKLYELACLMADYIDDVNERKGFLQSLLCKQTQRQTRK